MWQCKCVILVDDFGTMQVAPPDEQILNECYMVVTKFSIDASGATW